MDEKTEAWDRAEDNIRPSSGGGSSKFSPVPEASAFSKHAADCDGRRQEVRYMLCGAGFADALLTYSAGYLCGH